MAFNPNAYDALVDMLRAYGLDSLASAVLTFLQDGYTQEQVNVMIQDTPQYKTRFSGNDKRRAAGIPVLSPRDYLSVEDAYRQILSSNGLPRGFYDSPADFASWIGKDVSPQEIANRVNLAVEKVQKADPNELAALQAWHGVGANDLTAFFLDQDRALPLLQKISKSVSIGGSYGRQGLGINRGRAEELSGYVGDRNIDQLAAGVADLSHRGADLSSIYGGADYGLVEAEEEVFQNSETARRKRLALGAQEEATFGGASGVGKSTLARSKGY